MGFSLTLSLSFISVNFGRHMKIMWFFFNFVIRSNEKVLIQQPKWNVCLVLAISQTIEFHCFESNFDQLSWQICVGEYIAAHVWDHNILVYERHKKEISHKSHLSLMPNADCNRNNFQWIKFTSMEYRYLAATSIKHTPFRNQILHNSICIPNNNFIFFFVNFPTQAFHNWNHHLVLDLALAYRVSTTRAKQLTSEYLISWAKWRTHPATRQSSIALPLFSIFRVRVVSDC